MRMRIRILAFFVAVGALSSCAPKAIEAPLPPPPPLVLKQPFEDHKLNLLGQPDFNDILAEAYTWRGQVSAGDIYSFGYNLLRLGEIWNAQELKDLAVKSVSVAEKQKGFLNSVPFEKSPYLFALVGQSEIQAKQQLQELDVFLKDQSKEIATFLDRGTKAYPWPKILNSLPSAIDSLNGFFDWMLLQLKKKGIDPLVLSELKKALKVDYAPKLSKAKKLLEKIEKSKQSLDQLRSLDELIKYLKIDLDKNSAASVQQAKKLSQELSGVKDAQDILTFIIHLWKTLSAEQKKTIVFIRSAELYHFLNESSEKKLACMSDRKCNDLLWATIKRVKVLPTLEKFGVQNLKSLIDEGIRGEVISEARQGLLSFVPRIPAYVKTEVVAQMQKQRDRLEGIRHNFAKYIASLGSDWAEKNLIDCKAANKEFSLRTVAFNDITLDLNGKMLDLNVPGSQQFFTDSASIGWQMAYTTHLMQNMEVSDKEMGDCKAVSATSLQRRLVMRSAIENINRSLLLGGFRGSQQQLQPAYSVAINSPDPANTLLDLEHLTDSPHVFAVPDIFEVQNGYQMNRSNLVLHVSMKSQADLLFGLSQFVRYLRDWETNNFDKTLGQVKISDVVKEPTHDDSLEQPLFPKPMIFALGVGNASLILNNLLKDLSPLFLMDPAGPVLWGNQLDSKNPNPPGAIAGLVDLDGKARGHIVNAASIARFIVAISEFKQATDGVEKTSAPPLTQADGNGHKALDDLLKARDMLRMLTMALSNLLTHQLMPDETGGMAASYDLQIGTNSVTAKTLLDQVYAIEALLRASEITGMEMYKKASYGLYFNLNQNFWDEKLQFYVGNDVTRTRATPFEILTTLRILSDFQKQLAREPGYEESASQLQLLLQKWIEAIKLLRF